MKGFERFRSIVSILTVIIFLFSNTAWSAVPLWQGKIRPGVMAGSNDAETDYFIDLIMPITGDESSLLFFNPHLRGSDDESSEINIGLGYRKFVDNDNWILGGSLFYDAMESPYDNTFHQLGVGVEALSDQFDLRLNYYQPLGTTKEHIPDLDEYVLGPSSLLVFKAFEEALQGFDGEVGYLIPGISDTVETRIFGGGYWYTSDLASDITGFRARLEVRPMQILNINLEYKNDDLRDATYIGGYLNLPFSIGNIFSGGNPFEGMSEMTEFGTGTRTLAQRMTDKVIRDRHIVVEARVGETSETATNPETGEPILMIYVNEDNPEEGFRAGTLSDPLNHLMDAEEHDLWDDGVWVYVFSTDDQADEYNDVNISLLDDVVLWGEGFEFLGIGEDGGNPILVGNSSDPVIRLADSNEIMGFDITGGTSGIYGSGSSLGITASDDDDDDDDVITSAYIHHNNIYDNYGGASGIHINNNISDEDISGLNLSYIIANNTISGNSGDGVYIYTGASADTISDSSITINLSDNDINSNRGDNVNISNYVTARMVDSVDITNTFTDNVITDASGDGIGGPKPSPRGSGFIPQQCCDDDDDDGDGIDLFNEIFASDTISQSDQVASVTNSSITNTFTGNEISQNNNEGIESNNYLYASVYSNGQSIDGSLISEISDSSISNTYTNNTVSLNSSENIFIDNEIYTRTSSVNDTTITADATSTVSGSDITNDFMDNEISDSMRDEGVDINNLIEADAYTSNSPSTIEGDLTAEVTNSNISNTFNGDVVNRNDESNIEIENYIDAWTYSSSSTIDGNQSADVTDSGITNSFEDVEASSNEESGGCCDDDDDDDDGNAGIYVENDVTVFSGSSDSSDTIGGSITADITGTDISNSLISSEMMANAGDGVNFYSELVAGSSIYNSTIGNIIPGGDQSAGVSDSNITNTITGNNASNNGDDDDDDSDSDGMNIDSYVEAWVYANDSEQTINGDMAAEVTDTDITNTFTDNTANNNEHDNIEVDAEIYASSSAKNTSINGDMITGISGSDISNDFTDNETSGAKNDDGIDLDDVSITVYSYASSSTIEGDLRSEISTSTIDNTLTGNISSANNYDNIDMDDNEIYTYTSIYATSVSGDFSNGVSDASVTNTLTGNSIERSDSDDGLELDSYIYAQTSISTASVIRGTSDTVTTVDTFVEDSFIDNTFISNIVSSNSDHGIYIDNVYIFADTNINNSNIGDGEESTGDVSTSVTGSDITNLFENNTVSGNSDDEGVDIDDSDIYANSSISYSDLHGDLLNTEVSDVSVSNTFNNNNISGTDDDTNIEVYSEVYAGNYLYSSDIGSAQINVEVSDAGIDNSFENNTISSSSEDNGLYIDNEIYAWNSVNSSTTGDIMTAVTGSGSSITNTLTNNDISYNQEESLEMYNDIWANNYIYDSEIGVGDDDDDAAPADDDDDDDDALTAYVNEATITNIFDNNTVLSNERELNIRRNRIEAENAIYEESNVYGNVASEINLSSITNTFTDNDISGTIWDYGVEIGQGGCCDDDDDDGNVIRIENYTGSSSEIRGDLTADIRGSDIDNTFTDNTINNNHDGGVAIDNNEIFIFSSVYSDTSIGGSALFSIGDSETETPVSSSITNTFEGNDMSANGNLGCCDDDDDDDDDSDDGLYIHNNEMAIYTLAGSSTSFNNDYSSTITNGSITNTLTDNTLDNNMNDGFDIDHNYIYTGSSINNVTIGLGGSSFTSDISGAAINNTLTDNSLSYNEDKGVTISENYINIWSSANSTYINDDYASTISESSINNLFSGNDISYNDDIGVELYENYLSIENGLQNTRVGNDYSGEIADSSISNTFEDNTIDYNEDEGIMMDSNAIVVYNEGSSSTVERNISAIVGASEEGPGSSITNTFTDNSVSNNDDTGILIGYQGCCDDDDDDIDLNGNVIGAGNFMFEMTVGGDDDDDDDFVPRPAIIEDDDDDDDDDTLIADVNNSTITNSFTNNDIDYNDGTGVFIGSGDDDDDDDIGCIGGNCIIATNLIIDSPETVRGNAIATVTGSDVINEFDTNSISNNDYNGVYIEANTIYSLSSLDGVVEGDLVNEVLDSDITNTFTDNTITWNNGNGVYIGENTTCAASCHGEGANTINGSQLALISGAMIDNTFTGNTISYNSSDGVHMDNWIISEALNFGSVFGSLVAGTSDSNISNTYEGNTLDQNGQDGVDLNNDLAAVAVPASSVGEDILAFISSSDITDFYTSNSANSNGNIGLLLRYSSYASIEGDDDDDDGTEVEVFLEDNSLINNDFNGINLLYEGGGTFTGDLGGGLLGSLGLNLLYGNDNLNLSNATNVTLLAEDNWWGADADPDDGIGGDPVDYTPWLAALP